MAPDTEAVFRSLDGTERVLSDFFGWPTRTVLLPVPRRIVLTSEQAHEVLNTPFMPTPGEGFDRVEYRCSGTRDAEGRKIFVEAEAPR